MSKLPPSLRNKPRIKPDPEKQKLGVAALIVMGNRAYGGSYEFDQIHVGASPRQEDSGAGEQSND